MKTKDKTKIAEIALEYMKWDFEAKKYRKLRSHNQCEVVTNEYQRTCLWMRYNSDEVDYDERAKHFIDKNIELCDACKKNLKYTNKMYYAIHKKVGAKLKLNSIYKKLYNE